MSTIWILATTYDEAGPLRAYLNKARAEQDLALLKLLPEHDGEFLLKELPIFDSDAAPLPTAAAPVETPKPKEKAPRDLAADAIEAAGFVVTVHTPPEDLPQEIRAKWNDRTLRAAIGIVVDRKKARNDIESRAAAQTASSGASTERTDARSLEETAPESGGGAGASSEFPDTPTFLRRAVTRKRRSRS